MFEPSTPFLAVHHFFEIRQASLEKLNDEAFCEQLLYQLSERVGVTPLRSISNQFTPHGCSVVLLLAESHTSIHTWPEHGVALIDLFTCGKNKSAEPLERLLTHNFPEAVISCSTHQRGSLPSSAPPTP